MGSLIVLAKPYPSLTILYAGVVQCGGSPVVVSWPCMSENALGYSLNLSSNILADSLMYVHIIAFQLWAPLPKDNSTFLFHWVLYL